MSLGFLWRFLLMKGVGFLENALFKSYGVICWSSRSSLLLDELSTYKRDSDGFFSTRVVYTCRFSYTSHNSTDSWLIAYLSITSFLALYVRYLEPHEDQTGDVSITAYECIARGRITRRTPRVLHFAPWCFISNAFCFSKDRGVVNVNRSCSCEILEHSSCH